MSGGRWDYKGFTVKDALEQIGEDPAVKERFPALAALLPRLAETIYQMEHDLDWDLSHDSGIPNDTVFQTLLFERLEADIAEARTLGNLPGGKR